MNTEGLIVKEFDVERARKELKSCPKIVRDYVKLLISHKEHWQSLCQKAISKLREQPNTEK